MTPMTPILYMLRKYVVYDTYIISNLGKYVTHVSQVSFVFNFQWVRV